jgi:hypothetical protein
MSSMNACTWRAFYAALAGAEGTAAFEAVKTRQEVSSPVDAPGQLAKVVHLNVRKCGEVYLADEATTRSKVGAPKIVIKVLHQGKFYMGLDEAVGVPLFIQGDVVESVGVPAWVEVPPTAFELTAPRRFTSLQP